jgi:hypothetical protein
MKDSLWSCDWFRCESATLRAHLGSHRDGSVHPSHCWFWGSLRHRGWTGLVPDVQSSDSRANNAEVPQYRQRSLVSIPSVAGQPPSSGGDGNQDRALCALIPSVRRAAQNAWTAPCSGPRPTWRRSDSISDITIMSIARTPDAKGIRRCRVSTPISHEQISVVIDGRNIVEAYTKRRLPPDSSNSPPTGIHDCDELDPATNGAQEHLRLT